MAKKSSSFFETKNFGLLIGLLVFGVLLLISTQTVLISNLELKILDFNFRLKQNVLREQSMVGATVEQRNPKISQDILIIGIDDRSLDTFGRWPFPRYTEANLVNTFTRIRNENERERALLLDVFFIEPSVPEHDALLVQSIAENQRVFLESVLTRVPNSRGTEEEYFARQEILNERYGNITNIQGDWSKVETLYGIYPPLKPYARAAAGYGHAIFVEDDDQVYRRQPLVVKYAVVLERTIDLEELIPADLTEVEHKNFTRLAWVDTEGLFHDVPYPLTEQVIENLRSSTEKWAPYKTEDTDNDGEMDRNYYGVSKYKDNLLPSITLSLALEYFNKDLADLKIVLGKYIRIPSPQQFNLETQSWESLQQVTKPAVMDEEGNIVEAAQTRKIDEIRIPINDRAQMLINYMGMASSASHQGYQTYQVRSFAGYASRVPNPDPARWPRTMGVGNKILMVGPFSKGMAEDEKTTPFGLMFGVEIHTNALNTILMSNFLYHLPQWANALILLVMVLLTAFMASRVSTVWSLVLSLLLAILFSFAATVIFDLANRIITLSTPVLGVFLTFLAVIVYRIMTEEKDKRRIRDMFGTYVSPRVVDQLIANPPELGGQDKDMTVLFSDIRDFTKLSESVPPQELVNHLNEYFTAMTGLILEYEGTLDKYVGDEIMAFWGAPQPQEDHALLACQCALRQMEVLRELNEKWEQHRRINIGIGVNTGIMTVGNMGSLQRMDYTVTGDSVNLGARLEGTNKEYKTNIIISEYTYGRVKDRIIARELDDIQVKGKNKHVVIYELVDVIDGLEPPQPAVAGKPAARKPGRG